MGLRCVSQQSGGRVGGRCITHVLAMVTVVDTELDRESWYQVMLIARRLNPCPPMLQPSSVCPGTWRGLFPSTSPEYWWSTAPAQGSPPVVGWPIFFLSPCVAGELPCGTFSLGFQLVIRSPQPVSEPELPSDNAILHPLSQSSSSIFPCAHIIPEQWLLLRVSAALPSGLRFVLPLSMAAPLLSTASAATRPRPRYDCLGSMLARPLKVRTNIRATDSEGALRRAPPGED
jgi:hypothetical protein